MTKEELVAQNIKMSLGDLYFQLIDARAEVADLTQKLAEARAEAELKPVNKTNGKTMPHATETPPN